MEDVSRTTRSGHIVSMSTVKFLRTNGNPDTPFIAFELESEIKVDATTVNKETTKVLLLGETLCNHFMAFNPKCGDKVKIIAAVSYVKQGVLCIRPSEVDQVMVETVAQEVAEGVTFGLSREEFIEAQNYFRKQ